MDRRNGGNLGKKEAEANTEKEDLPESLIFFPRSFEDQSEEDDFESLDIVTGSMRGIVV